MIFLDATSASALSYVESFGVPGEARHAFLGAPVRSGWRCVSTLQARSDRTGFNFPTGIAVMAPTGSHLTVRFGWV